MSESTDDGLLDDAVEYFSTCFPNPMREGCPQPAHLRELASSVHLVTGELRTHMLQCSECFKEFRRQRLTVASTADRSLAVPSGIRAHGQTVAIAASLVMAVGLGLVLWIGFERTAKQQETANRGSVKPTSAQQDSGKTARLSSARSASDLPGVVALQLRSSELRRGTYTSIESATPVIAIGPRPIRFEIQLPAGYADGLYHVAIVDPFDEVLVQASARAVDRVLVAVADATGLKSGRRFLRIGVAGQPPDYLPIFVEQPAER